MHTQGKLEVKEGSYLYATDGSFVAKTTGNMKRYQDRATDEANAARLALCWNSHDEFIEALKRLEVSVETAKIVFGQIKDAGYDMVAQSGVHLWAEAANENLKVTRALLDKLKGE